MKVVQFFRICSIFQYIFEGSVQNFQKYSTFLKNDRFKGRAPACRSGRTEFEPLADFAHRKIKKYSTFLKNDRFKGRPPACQSGCADLGGQRVGPGFGTGFSVTAN